MEEQFNQPQRQSSIGVLVMFVDTLQLWARGLWPVILIYFVKFKQLNSAYLALGIIAFLLVIVIVAYLKYLNFTFHLDSKNEEFIINEGVLNKKRTIIQLERIQQVDINQSFLQRIIGVYELNVDTAGSAKKEGRIKAISHPLAVALKTKLLENEIRNVTLVNEEEFLKPSIDSQKPFVKISFLSLLKVGITTNYVKTFGLVLAFLTTIFDSVKKVIPEYEVTDEQLDSYIDQNLAFRSIAILFVVMIGLILVINLIRVVFKYYNYQVIKHNDSLFLSFGLLNTKSTIVKPEKVQIVTVTRNYFQKKMDILEIKIKQATSGDRQNSKSIIEIPGCDENEKTAIFKLLFHVMPEKGIRLKPNYRKLVFSIFVCILIPVVLFFVCANFVDQSIMDYAFVVSIYVVFIGLIICFGYLNNRLYISDDFIIKQSGAWDIDNAIIDTKKIQGVTTSQLFWHKKADIGSVIIHTAGGDLAFQLGNFTILKQHINHWLYNIERSESNWM